MSYTRTRVQIEGSSAFPLLLLREVPSAFTELEGDGGIRGRDTKGRNSVSLHYVLKWILFEIPIFKMYKKIKEIKQKPTTKQNPLNNQTNKEKLKIRHK